MKLLLDLAWLITPARPAGFDALKSALEANNFSEVVATGHNTFTVRDAVGRLVDGAVTDTGVTLNPRVSGVPFQTVRR